MNRKIVLVERPKGMVAESCFNLIKESIPQSVPEGHILVKNLYASIDPAMRGWITDMKSYLPPVKIGEVMRAQCIAEVIESKHAKFTKGDLVQGTFGWQDYALSDGRGVVKVPKGPLNPTTFLGVLGMTGFTAYFGLLDIGQPKAGETVLVSGAAGATGSVAGQIAKIKGCRVVGTAGTDEKCRWLKEECGFDAAINYKNPKFREELKAACPNGVDVFFDNVGGEMLDTALRMLNLRARVVLCGSISTYNDSPRPIKNYAALIPTRGKIQGFIVFDYAKQYPTALNDLSQWIQNGQLKFKEHIVDGLENCPKALRLLFTGDNTGKLIVKFNEPSIKSKL